MLNPTVAKNTAVIKTPSRGRLSQYFVDVWTGIVTILEGMWVTLAHLFRPTITVQYPKEKIPLYPRTRVMLVNHIEDCGFCMSCKRVCPADIFTITGVRADPGEDLGMLPDGKPKKIHITDFKIDMSKCIYCGLCVDVCDTKSLRWEQPQEKCVFDRRELHIDFSGMTEARRHELIERDEARKKAKAAAPKPATEPGATPSQSTPPSEAS